MNEIDLIAAVDGYIARIAAAVNTGAATAAHFCGVDRGWPETPQTGWCCEGSLYRGAAGCACWTPVYDDNGQQEPDLAAATPMRFTMCDSCAYRPGSPERAGDPKAVADADDLNTLVYSGTPFWCHQGMRRPTHWLHPPSGMTVPWDGLDFHCPQVDGRPYKLDGAPADLCAGWAARRLHYMGQIAKQAADGDALAS